MAPILQNVIQPLSLNDIPTLASDILSTHLSLAPYQLLFPDWSFRIPELTALYQAGLVFDFHDPAIEMLKMVDDRGGIVGLMVLVRKRPILDATVNGNGNGKAEVTEEIGVIETGGLIDKNLWGLWKEGVKEVEKNMIAIDHLEISHISINPAYRRRGNAITFLDLAKDRSHKASIPLSITATPSIYSLLRKNGFVDNSFAELGLADWISKEKKEGAGYGKFRLYGMLAATGFS